MSSGLMIWAAFPKSMVVEPFSPSPELKSPLVIGMPLTTNSAWLFPVREPAPRMVTLADAVGPAALVWMLTPAILPFKDDTALVTGTCETSLPSSDWMA